RGEGGERRFPRRAWRILCLKKARPRSGPSRFWSRRACARPAQRHGEVRAGGLIEVVHCCPVTRSLPLPLRGGLGLGRRGVIVGGKGGDADERRRAGRGVLEFRAGPWGPPTFILGDHLHRLRYAGGNCSGGRLSRNRLSASYVMIVRLPHFLASRRPPRMAA